jgi:hypothetical protein
MTACSLVGKGKEVVDIAFLIPSDVLPKTLLESPTRLDTSSRVGPPEPLPNVTCAVAKVSSPSVLFSGSTIANRLLPDRTSDHPPAATFTSDAASAGDAATTIGELAIDRDTQALCAGVFLPPTSRRRRWIHSEESGIHTSGVVTPREASSASASTLERLVTSTVGHTSSGLA